MEEYEDFYDFSSNYEDMSDNDDNDNDVSDDESNSPGVAEINSIGEMVLPSGRVLGKCSVVREFVNVNRVFEYDCIANNE